MTVFDKNTLKDDYMSPSVTSALALDVYRTDQPIIPSDIIHLCDCPEQWQKDDYFGAAHFLLYRGHLGILYISHRGTVLDLEHLGNIYADLEIWLNEAPYTFKSSAFPFTQYAIAYAKEKMGESLEIWKVFHIGHSLGAVLAELCWAALVPIDAPYSAGHQTATFENPGTRLMVQNLIDEGKILPQVSQYLYALSTYQADYNAINTCSEQLVINGNFDVCNRITELNKESLWNPWDEEYYVFDFTMDQHSMKKMHDYIVQNMQKIYKTDEGAPVNFPSEEIVGYEDGLSYYRNYKRRYDCYWDIVLLQYWDFHVEIHADYDDNFFEFKQQMIDDHLSGDEFCLEKEDMGFQVIELHRKNKFNLDIYPEYQYQSEPAIKHRSCILS